MAGDREGRAKGGHAMVAKYGRDFMAEMGRKSARARRARAGDAVGKPGCLDDAELLERAMRIFTLSERGWDVGRVALLYGISPRTVRREMAMLPELIKGAIRRAERAGKESFTVKAGS